MSATGEREPVARPAAQHKAAAVNAAGVAADTQSGGSDRISSSPDHPSSAPLPAPPAGQARPNRAGGLLQALMQRALAAAPMPGPSIATASPRVAQQGDVPAAAVPAAVQPELAAAVPGGTAAGQASLQEGTVPMPDATQAGEGAAAGTPGRAGAAPAATEQAAAAGVVAGLAAPAAAPVEPTVVKSAGEAGPVSSAPGQPPKRQRTSSAAQEPEAAAGAAPAGATSGAEQSAEEPARQPVGATDAVQQATASAGPPSTGHAATSSSTEINQRRQGQEHSPARGAAAAALGGGEPQAAEGVSQDAAPAEASTASAAAPVQPRGSQAAGGFKQRPAPFSAGPARSLVQPVRAPAAAQHPLFSSSMSMPGSRPGAAAPASSWYAPHPYPTPQAQPRAPHYAAPAHPAGTLSLPPGPAASARAVQETAWYGSAACASWAAPAVQGWTAGQPSPAGPWTPAVPAPSWGPQPPPASGCTAPFRGNEQLFAQLSPTRQGAVLDFAAQHQQVIPPARCRELAIHEFLVSLQELLRRFS